jgi:hypothetical protein
MMETLQADLQSFFNTYRAVLNRLAQNPASYVELNDVLGIKSGSIRQRRHNPELWKLSEIAQLAAHFDIAISNCEKLQNTLSALPPQLNALSRTEKSQQVRLLKFETSRIMIYNKSGWPVSYLSQMQQNLLNGLQMADA